MRLRALCLSALSATLLLTACDGSSSAPILTDVPTAGVPDAPSVVTKGSVPGGSTDTGATTPSTPTTQTTIVGNWGMSVAATESSPAYTVTLAFLANGTGSYAVKSGAASKTGTLAWKRKGTAYVVTIDGEDESATVSGNTLTLVSPDGDESVFTRK